MLCLLKNIVLVRRVLILIRECYPCWRTGALSLVRECCHCWGSIGIVRAMSSKPGTQRQPPYLASSTMNACPAVVCVAIPFQRVPRGVRLHALRAPSATDSAIGGRITTVANTPPPFDGMQGHQSRTSFPGFTNSFRASTGSFRGFTIHVLRY